MAEQEAAVADSGQGDVGGGQDSGFDMDQASEQLAGDLFPEIGQKSEESDDVELDTADPAQDKVIEAATEATKTEASTTSTTTEEIEPAPKTWPKEMHEHWGKTPKEVRDYWNTREKQMLDGLDQYKGDASFGRQMRDVITPYQALIEAQGVDGPKAVQALMNAHYRLTVSPPSQKMAYFAHLAQQYGVDLGNITQQQSQDQQQVDPRYQQLQDQLHQIQQHLTGQQQTVQKQEHERVAKEVNAFAADAAHPYFDDVADDMVPFLKSGASLQDAYDKAVWANPVTRAKEQARIQQDQQAEAKRKAQEAADAAKKAAAANIRSRDTRRTPTEQQRGTMRNLDSVMTEVMREIKQAH